MLPLLLPLLLQSIDPKQRPGLPDFLKLMEGYGKHWEATGDNGRQRETTASILGAFLLPLHWGNSRTSAGGFKIFAAIAGGAAREPGTHRCGEAGPRARLGQERARAQPPAPALGGGLVKSR